MNYGLYVTLMVVCLCFSAFFSASETAFTSANKVKIKTLAADGNKKAQRVQKLIEKYDKMISAVLIGNNIVNIALSTMATMVFVNALAGKVDGDLSATISTIICTIVVLVLGEVTPKTIAKEFPEQIAIIVAPIIQGIMFIFTPFCAIFTLIRKGLDKLFKNRKKSDAFTEDELLTIVDEAESVGSIEAVEGDLIRSAIEFNDRTAGEILTHRVDVVAAPVTISAEDFATLVKESGYSRIPIYQGSIDNIIGVVHEKDFYSQIYNTQRSVCEIMKPPVLAVESVKISSLLQMLQKNKLHIAVITDEFGGTQGIVTVEDILEELVGEIWDETDEREEDVVKISDTEYVLRGDADVNTLNDYFDVETEEYDATTVGGLVNELTGNMPKEGEVATIENLKMTITKVQHRRVIELKVEIIPKDEKEKDKEKDEE